MPLLQSDFVDALLFLVPKPSPVPLIRIGGNGDGAYLIPDDLEGIKDCLSPGVSDITHFEDELAETFNIRSDMIDASISGSELNLNPNFQKFRPLFLDIDNKSTSINLNDWVNEYSDDSNDLLLQIDIEGAEYRNILASSESTLKRFRVIAIELHGLNAAKDPVKFMQEIGSTLLKLKNTHTSIHASPNNCCGQIIEPLTGLNIPNVLEVTLLRNDRLDTGRRIPIQLPHDLDIIMNTNQREPLILNDSWLQNNQHKKSNLLNKVTKYSYPNKVRKFTKKFWAIQQWPIKKGRQPWTLVTPEITPEGPFPELKLPMDFVWVSGTFNINIDHMKRDSIIEVELMTPHHGLTLQWKTRSQEGERKFEATAEYSDQTVIRFLLRKKIDGQFIQFKWVDSETGHSSKNLHTGLISNVRLFHR